MDISYNIIAVELLELVKTGWGITQACRKLGINNSDLVVCLNRNLELASAVKERFNITADGLAIKTNKDDDERAQLRARAEQLGLSPHSQMGVKKLKKLIEDAEADAAAKNTPPQPDPKKELDNSENPNGDTGVENAGSVDAAAATDTNPDGGTENK